MISWVEMPEDVTVLLVVNVFHCKMSFSKGYITFADCTFTGVGIVFAVDFTIRWRKLILNILTEAHIAVILASAVQAFFVSFASNIASINWFTFIGRKWSVSLVLS